MSRNRLARLVSRRRSVGVVVISAGLIAAACGGGGGSSGAPVAESEPAPAVAAEPQAEAAPAPATAAEPAERPATFLPLDVDVTAAGDAIIRSQFRPRIEEEFAGWRTNWNIRIIDVNELRFGGVPRDGIESIDRPRFETIAAVDSLYSANTPVIQVEVNGDVRAYPLQILTWHEVANDVIGGVPVVVTFCPLCNSAIAYERTVNGAVYEFGVTGALRFSDLVMYDRTTESLWQQIGGKAIVGNMVGAALKPIPAPIVSWQQFKDAFPDGLVLSWDTGTSRDRDYSRNPYPGYDDINSNPFFVDEEDLDGRLASFERIVAVEIAGQPLAYAFSWLSKVGVVNDQRGELPFVVFWTPGTASGLDTRDIALGRDVGSTGVFEAELDGRVLSFAPAAGAGDRFIDDQTGSVWNVFGRALSGPLAGAQLTEIVHANHFWFAWAAFQPETEIVTAATVAPRG